MDRILSNRYALAVIFSALLLGGCGQSSSTQQAAGAAASQVSTAGSSASVHRSFLLSTPAITLPKTGQTGCWNAAGGSIACAGTGEDGDKLKGAAWPGTRFVDQANGTVRDDLTGLVWLKNGNCFGTKSWINALNNANTLASGSCSLTDNSTATTWRLPNRKELLSLANYQQANVATWLNLAAQKFTGVQANKYWTADSYSGGAGSKWYVSHDAGWSSYDVAASTYYVWPVRDFSATIGSNPALKDFGNVASGATSASQTFTLGNTGLDPLVVSSISLTGGDAAMFSVSKGDGTGGTCGATPTIAPGGSCTIAATFSPSSSGAKSTTLRIASNDPATANKDLALSGTGAAPPPTPDPTPAPPPPPDPATVPLTFGTATGGSISAATQQSDITGGKTSWFTFTPSSSGNSVSVQLEMKPGYGFLSSTSGSITNGVFNSGSLSFATSIAITSITRNGHATGSGTADISDALLVLRIANGESVTLTNEQKIRYDVAPFNSGMVPLGDAQVNIYDAIAILRRALGIGNW